MTEEEIPEFWKKYRKALIVPDGYEVEWTGMFNWFLTSETHSFRLTDRPFEEMEIEGQRVSGIDYWTGQCISRVIEKVIAEKGKARVLDISCGPLNRAAHEIATKYGDKVEVHALDICDSRDRLKASNLERKVGSALELPYEDGSIDVVYSFQFLQSSCVLPNETIERAIEEVTRVMAERSHAVIDVLDIFRHQNPWLEKYLPGHTHIRDDPFFGPNIPYHQAWLINHEDTYLGFRPVTEFNNCEPGFMALNQGVTPYLHITKGDQAYLCSGLSVHKE